MQNRGTFIKLMNKRARSPVMTRVHYSRYMFFSGIVIIIMFSFFLSLIDMSVFQSERQIFFETQYIDPLDDHSLQYCNQYNTSRVNGAIVVLVRNKELHALRETMKHFEDRWNRKYHYPYVFLNDEEFTEEFKILTSAITKSETHYGRIPQEMWSYPSWINQTRAAEARHEMESKEVLYGGSESYRHMCRFNSGFFFRHELIKKYDYYWRLEPGVEFLCDIDYDPFRFIQKNNITYGFTISLLELQETIPTLWDTVVKFSEEYPQYLNERNVIKFMSANGKTYNGCHFWSNFEIGDLNFWRGEAYMKFFEYLDKAGGFFYERWGDAPVHSIALALFLEKSQIHFFNDIGYKHSPFQHCPIEKRFHESGKCFCNPSENFDVTYGSCTKNWFAI